VTDVLLLDVTPLSLGIETGDSDLMKTHKPGVHIDEVRDTVRRIQAKASGQKGFL